MMIMGRIVAPFGIKGWLRIQPFGDDPQSWADMPQWWISPDDGAPESAWQPVELTACKPHGTGLVASFREAPDRNAAEALKGWYVAAPREAMPDPGEQTYYWEDLTGLSVVNREGEALGQVVGLLTTGAHDVLRVVDADGTERLIPFVEAYVPEVDLEAGRITVDWQRDW